MTPVSLQAGHFLGLQRVSTLLPHFSQVKTAMITPPNQIKPPFLATAAKRYAAARRQSRDLGGHIIMNNTWFRQDIAFAKISF
jgi:phage terminase large subunit-like protein